MPVKYELYRFFRFPAHAVSMANVDTIKGLNLAIEKYRETDYRKSCDYQWVHPEKLTLAHFDDENPIVLARTESFDLKVVKKVK